MISRRLVSSVAFGAITLLAGCATAPKEPQSMIDPKANFSEFETFSLLHQPSAENPMSMVESMVRDAITAGLESKGYVQSPAGETGDLLIDYDGARQETIKNRPFSVGIGVGSYGSHGGASVSTRTSNVKNVTEGSLVVNAIDSARGAEIWRSQVTRELGEGGANSATVNSVVAEVLSDFPARVP